MATIYRPVPGYVDLYAGMDASIVHGERGELEQKLYKNHRYLSVNIPHIGESKFVHRLVAAAFLGPCPQGMQVRHGEAGALDNGIGNLCYGTAKDNAQDNLRHGTNHHASKTHCVRGHELSPANVYTQPDTIYRACRQCRATADHARKIRTPEERQQRKDRIAAKKLERETRIADRQTLEKTKAAIDAALAADPTLSNRSVAKLVGVSHTTVNRLLTRRYEK